VNITVDVSPESEAHFDVRLEWDEIEKAAEKAVRRLSQTQKIPGFRPGHAPRAMIERLVGRDAIYADAIEDLAADAIRKAAAEHELTLLVSPHAHVDAVQYEETNEVSATVPVLARGELADYQDLRVGLTIDPVTEEDIDKIVERARDDSAIWQHVDRPAEVGDRVTIQIKVVVGEKTVSEYKEQKFTLVDDRTGLFTGMDAEIVRMNEGETKEFTLTIPEDFLNADYAGKEANYTVTVDVIEHKLLPDADDPEFLRKSGEFETVEAMRDSIRGEMEAQRRQTAVRNQRTAVVDALIERLTLAVPTALVDAETEDMIADLDQMLSGQGMGIQTLLQASGQNMDEYRATMQPEALRRIKRRRVLELLADREGIAVSAQDVQKVLEEYNAASAGRKRMRMQDLTPAQRRSLESSLKRDRAEEWAMDHLTESATSATMEDTSATSDTPAPEVAPEEPAEVDAGSAQ
jgi:trigger factor